MNDPAAAEPTAAVDANRAGSQRETRLRATLQDIILADGFARLSVSEMAQRLGCSKRTIYELASTKNELVLQVITMFFETLRADAALATADCDHDPAQQIFEYLQVGVRAALRLSPVAIADIDKWEPARRIWQEHIRLRVDGLRVLIERGIETGIFRDINSVLVAEMVFAGLNRLREPDFYRSTDLTVAEAFEEYYRMLLHALVHPGAGA
jgi:AcrR family transcriptional regulator